MLPGVISHANENLSSSRLLLSLVYPHRTTTLYLVLPPIVRMVFRVGEFTFRTL
jgi:hypothetical protein